MSGFIAKIVFAQIKPDDLEHVKALPRSFGADNITKGLTIAFGVAGGIALIVVAYGGLKFVLSQGNPQEITKAKNTIIDGLIGLAVIIASGGIVGFVVNALT